MTVIIKTKGVYDPNDCVGAAGWGVVLWTRRDGFFTRGGAIEDQIKGSTEAELIAVHKGIHEAQNLGLLERGGRVEVQTDSRELVAVLLHLIPSAQCLGPTKIECAIRVRRDLRESATMPRLIDDVRLNGLEVVFFLMKADNRALAAARIGMNQIRLRAAAR